MMKITEEPVELREMLDAITGMKLAMKQFFQRKIKEGDFDITYEMLHLMSVLWRKGQLNQQEIANNLMKNKASITPLIDNLSKRNLVMRAEDPADRRNKIIMLTKEGKEYKKKFMPVISEFYERLEKGIPAQDLKATSGMLMKMKENLEF